MAYQMSWSQRLSTSLIPTPPSSIFPTPSNQSPIHGWGWTAVSIKEISPSFRALMFIQPYSSTSLWYTCYLRSTFHQGQRKPAYCKWGPKQSDRQWVRSILQAWSQAKQKSFNTRVTSPSPVQFNNGKAMVSSGIPKAKCLVFIPRSVLRCWWICIFHRYWHWLVYSRRCGMKPKGIWTF